MKNIKKHESRIKKDIKIIQDTDGNDLKERLEIAKLARMYERNNFKDGILKNKPAEES